METYREKEIRDIHGDVHGNTHIREMEPIA
jgi:hypothetical protein